MDGRGRPASEAVGIPRRPLPVPIRDKQHYRKRAQLPSLMAGRPIRGAPTAAPIIGRDEVLEEFDSLLADVFRANTEFEAFLSSGALSRETKAEIITASGRVIAIRFRRVTGRRPLSGSARAHFAQLVRVKAQDILRKWTDVFVLNKPVEPEMITRRLR